MLIQKVIYFWMEEIQIEKYLIKLVKYLKKKISTQVKYIKLLIVLKEGNI